MKRGVSSERRGGGTPLGLLGLLSHRPSPRWAPPNAGPFCTTEDTPQVIASVIYPMYGFISCIGKNSRVLQGCSVF